jgi:hypothetical protein
VSVSYFIQKLSMIFQNWMVLHGHACMNSIQDRNRHILSSDATSISSAVDEFTTDMPAEPGSVRS